VHRVRYFGAGPGALPLEVIQKAGQDLPDWRNTGASIMETSHRSREYVQLHEASRSMFKHLMGMDENWEVLFLQGGATTQFAMLPMNFLGPYKGADYVLTGAWSNKAFNASRYFGPSRIAADTRENEIYTRIPAMSELDMDADATYCHLTTNNTIYGTQWKKLPETGKVPLVLDMSSDIMSRQLNLDDVGLIYASAQKNLGPAGVCVVAIRKEMLDRANSDLPEILSYRAHAAKSSLLNTPPTFNVYMMKLVLDWIESRGGVKAMERLASAKASLIYDIIDSSNGFYKCPVPESHRSKMNAVFSLPDEQMENELVAKAKADGFTGIRGHRSLGGLRVSMYNAVSLESIIELAAFLKDFAKRNG